MTKRLIEAARAAFWEERVVLREYLKRIRDYAPAAREVDSTSFQEAMKKTNEAIGALTIPSTGPKR